MKLIHLLITVVIGRLLNLANRDVPSRTRQEFYELKQRLLKKYGTYVKLDHQHIKKKCNSCGGGGVFRCSYKLPETCFSCMGSGIYIEFWTQLEKYKLGSFSFHNPLAKLYFRPQEISDDTMIEGYITHHPPTFHGGREAMFWLYLFFDRKSFVREFGACQVRNGKGILINIERVYFSLKYFRLPQIQLPYLRFNFRFNKLARKKMEYSVDDELPF